jgi:hypothetical protein
MKILAPVRRRLSTFSLPEPIFITPEILSSLSALSVDGGFMKRQTGKQFTLTKSCVGNIGTAPATVPRLHPATFYFSVTELARPYFFAMW